MNEARCCLNGWPVNPTDVGAVLEAEAGAGCGVCDAFGDFEGYIVEEVHVLDVVDDECVLGFEAEGNEVEGVLVGVFLGFFECGFVVDEEFLVVGYLEVEPCPEFLLQMKRENPRNQMSDVHRP